jgi:general nucleoside transport system permease protein
MGSVSAPARTPDDTRGPTTLARGLVGRLRGAFGVLSIALPIVALLCALLTGAALIAASHVDPIATYKDMASAAFGSSSSLSVTIERSIPPLLTALGVAVALRAGLWNIGGDGQIYCGAMASTAVVLYMPTSPFHIVLILALLAGIAAGAVWGFIPGILRAKRGISEVITSLMLVYIAIQLTGYMLTGPWAVSGATSPATDPFPAGDLLPIIWPDTLLNAGAIITLLVILAVWVLLSHSTLGLRLRAIGGSVRASHVMGLRVSRLTVGAMMISGALAGLAGSVDTLGYEGRLLQGFSPSWGFEAIAIALIGRLQPVGIAFAALFFGALDAGSAGLLTSGNGISQYIAQIIEGIAVVYLLVAVGVLQILGRRRQRKSALDAAHSHAAAAPTTRPVVES